VVDPKHLMLRINHAVVSGRCGAFRVHRFRAGSLG
jgi:hypothetical protein